MKLLINDIKIGKRLRDDYGDLARLADSIKQHGLLHPIIVDSSNNLVAGCRRLLACERLGWKEIEVKALGELTEKELRILELEENIQRKDLTELEKSKNLVELAGIKEYELKELNSSKIELMSESDTNSGKVGNNSSLEEFNTIPKQDEVMAESTKTEHESKANCAESAHLNNPNKIGIRTLAKEIGIPPKTLHDAQQHVKAVEEYPELEELPKYKAIETAKELRNVPQEEQGKILDLALRKQKKEQEERQKDENYYKYMDECGRVNKKFITFIYALERLDASESALKMCGELLDNVMIEDFYKYVTQGIPKLVNIQKFLKGEMNGKKQERYSEGNGNH